MQGTLGKPGRHIKQVKHLKQVGGDRGFRVSRSLYHVLPPPVVLCPFASRLPPFIVLLCLQVNQEDQKPGFNFQTVHKLNIFVHFLAFVSAWDYWVPVKVITGHDLWCNRIEGIYKFTGINAVFPARVQIYVFLLPKFSFKHWWMLNGNFKTSLDKCFWLNNAK